MTLIGFIRAIFTTKRVIAKLSSRALGVLEKLLIFLGIRSSSIPKRVMSFYPRGIVEDGVDLSRKSGPYVSEDCGQVPQQVMGGEKLDEASNLEDDTDKVENSGFLNSPDRNQSEYGVNFKSDELLYFASRYHQELHD